MANFADVLDMMRRTLTVENDALRVKGEELERAMAEECGGIAGVDVDRLTPLETQLGPRAQEIFDEIMSIIDGV